MADTNDFSAIKAEFENISAVLDSIRAQSAMSAGSSEKMLATINRNLETLANEENSDLIKVFIAEMKKSLEEKHNFVSSKFSELESAVISLSEKTETQLQASEIKEVFDIIATNLGVVSKDFSQQKELITDLGLKIQALQEDDSEKRDILRNIAVLKVELEKFSNGFESIIINLNNNFKETASTLSGLDSSEALDGIKKDIENVFLSSNAILSTMQVIDRKNRELEEVIKHVVTKDDFELEREQVAKLIAQNVEIANFISTLPKQNNIESLSEKVDTAVGVINALKNMLTETGKQNQKLLSAQLDNLESKILNISTEEEFIGFRKELSDFSKEIFESTNVMRSDIADTNSQLKELLSFLSAMDIKSSFENFASLTKISEANVKESISEISSQLTKSGEKNKDLISFDVSQSTETIKEKISESKEELKQNSKNNQSTILEHIQSVINNIFSIKNALHVEISETSDSTKEKIAELKENVISSNNFLVQNSKENLDNILANLENIYNEVSTVKADASKISENNTQNLSSGFNHLLKKIGEIKDELNETSRENSSSILAIVEDFSKEFEGIKASLNESTKENADEIKSFISELADKLTAIKNALKDEAKSNSEEVKSSISEAIQAINTIKYSFEQTTSSGFDSVRETIEELAQQIEGAQENLLSKSEINASKILSTFEQFAKEFDAHKSFMSESAQINFESVSLYIQNLNKRIEETKEEFSQDLSSNLSQLNETIEAIPQTVKENQIAFENEKRILLEENSRNIVELGEKIQALVKGIISKDNPFKENMLGELIELKNSLSSVKEEISASNKDFSEHVEILVNESLQSIENAIEKYTDTYKQGMYTLQASLNNHFESAQSSQEESSIKIENAIRETLGVKEELQKVIKMLALAKEDSSLQEFAAETTKKFEGILLNITQLEEIFSSKSRESLASTLTRVDNAFNSISSSIKEYQQFNSSELHEFLKEVEDKNEELKNQIGLTSTDIINSIESKNETLTESLSNISAAIDGLTSVNLEETITELKENVETSQTTLSSLIKENSKREGLNLLTKLEQEFDALSEKLEEITNEINTSKRGEFEELKSAIDSISYNVNDVLNTVNDKIEAEFFTQNFNTVKASVTNSRKQLEESLNDALQSLLEKIEQTTQDSSLLEEKLHSAKEDIFERLDGIKERLIDSQKESVDCIVTELAQVHGDIKTSLLEKIDETALSTREDYNLSTKNSVKEVLQIELDSSRTQVYEKLESLEEKLVNCTDIAKSSLFDELTQVQNSNKQSILNEIKKAQLSIENEIGEKLTEKIEHSFEEFSSIKDTLIDAQDDTKSALAEDFINAHETSKNEIISQIIQSQSQTESKVLEELGENINLLKEFLQLSSRGDEIKEEVSEKVQEISLKFDASLKELEENIKNSQESLKSSSQALLSEVKTSFNDKVEDSFDELRSFIEILENKKDIDSILDKIKDELYGKIEAAQNSIEISVDSISVKKELDDVALSIKESIDSLSQSISEKISTSFDENQTLCAVGERSEEVNRRMEELKNFVEQEIIQKLDCFELSVDNKNLDFSNKLAEMSDSLVELKESFIDLSLNSNMEMSASLVTVQEKVDSMLETISALNFREDVLQSIETTKTEFNDNLLKGIESIHEKLDSINFGPDEETKANVEEIRNLIDSQSAFIEKIEKLEKLDSLDKLEQLDNLTELESLSDVKLEIKEALNSFNEKLQTLEIKEDKNQSEEENSTIKETLNGFKAELFEHLIEIFNQISFVEESEDLKDFIEEKTGEIKNEIKEALISQIGDGGFYSEPNADADYGSIGDIRAFVDITKKELRESLKSTLGNNFTEIISSLDILHEKTGSVDHSCFNLVSDIKEIKNKLSSLNHETQGTHSFEDDSYTLLDVESDIAKIRLALKELAQSKENKTEDSFEKSINIEGIENINEALTSISTRTNKLLLNSDESYNVLKDNLNDFRNIVYNIESSIKHLDNSSKLDEINKLMISSVNSDKIFNQTFMYLAQWIDCADEKLEAIESKLSEVDEVKKSLTSIEKNMLKSTDLEALFIKFEKKFDQQQTKIKSLEEKIEKLSKKPAAKTTKDTDLKTLVKEVLAQFDKPEKVNATLAKKVDNIDKQLATFGKSIEKITSYVD